ncbi:hypothetical protein HSX11_29940 [Oxalobacteraceae bacterium]|nr:hypothetical protein [Oxalobacteraceae bacterium]
MFLPARPTPRLWIGLSLTVLLHCALLYGFMQRKAYFPPETTTPRHPAIQWLLPLAPPKSAPLLPSRPETVKRSAAPRRPDATATVPRDGHKRPPVPQPPAGISAPVTTAPVAPAAPQAITPEPPAPPDSRMPDFSQAPAAPTADDIMRQARRDIGKIDKDLRKAYPVRGEQAPNDSKQARLERGINAAHENVLPKWYEAAKMQEISRSGSQNRVYKISTALGIYCITIKPDGEKMYSSCPQ